VNRERMLFAAVLALIALWYFVFREDAKIQPPVKPGTKTVEVLEVAPVTTEVIHWRLPEPYGAFTRVTNEREHPRPALPAVAPRDLPNIWVPTSIGLRLKLLGRYRHETVAPVEGPATIELPAVAANGGNGPANGGAPANRPERLDSWTALGRPMQGRVLRIKRNGTWIKEPAALPAPGPVEEGSFYRLMFRCQTEQAAAAQDGVTDLEVRLSQGTVVYAFPRDINNVQAAIGGSQQPWWEGLLGYLRLPEPRAGGQQHLNYADRMIQAGVRAEPMDPRLEWALVALQDVLAVTPKTIKKARKDIVERILEAAGALYRHEQVLKTAFEFLADYPDEDDIILVVGDLLASRTFNLPAQAEEWYAKAARNPDVQARRVEVLLRLQRFEEAREIVDSGRAGTGAEVDILAGRTALALGDFETAVRRATPHTAGQHAVEANLILGGVAYAQGDAARAADRFLAAIERDPRHSRAYSDLGLALAVQGKKADALACFARAEELDFENTVTPALGRLYLHFAAARREREILEQMELRRNKAEFEKPLAEARQARDDALAAASALVAGGDGLEANNPLNLLVRFFAGYTLERQGELKAAHDKYRSVIDNDHRYRVAIARLGVVLARFLEANPGDPGAEEFAKAADAHLTKSQALNPDDPVVPYILARFHMLRGTSTAKATRMFGIAADKPAPEGDVDLPNWARAGAAALAYRSEDNEVGPIKSRFADVQADVRQRLALSGTTDLEKALAQNEVYVYCQRCLDMISENQRKRVVEYTFRTIPKEWEVKKREKMQVGSNGQALAFRGQIQGGGGESDPLEENAVLYASREVTRDTFFRLDVEGVIPEGCRVQFGVGALMKRRARGGSEYRGIKIVRKQEGLVALAIDGARESEQLQSAGRFGTLLDTSVRWEPGPFTLRIEVADRDKGMFRIRLRQGDNEDVHVLKKAFGIDAETTRLLTRGGGGGPIQFYLWVQGRDGTEYSGVLVKKVSLVKGEK